MKSHDTYKAEEKTATAKREEWTTQNSAFVCFVGKASASIYLLSLVRMYDSHPPLYQYKRH
jgi:hypothetical protein